MNLPKKHSLLAFHLLGWITTLTCLASIATATNMPVPVLPIVAHRGASFHYPENTVASLQAAIDLHVDGCEFDVHATRDGQLVVIHDKSLNRTTNITAPIGENGKPVEMLVADKDYADISTLDAGSWKSPKFKGQKLPTLDATLTLFKATRRTAPVIEIKDEGIEAKVIEAIRQADLMDRAVVIAFSESVVAQVRRLEPKLPVALLYGRKFEGTAVELADMLAGKARALDITLLDLNHELLSKEAIALLHERGLKVWTWTVDDPARMNDLLDWGVGSITTNRPDLLLKIVAQRNTSGK